jgi:hypothetical protein
MYISIKIICNTVRNITCVRTLIQETSEISSPFRCEQSGSSEQSFYGKITNSIPIPLVSHAPENLEMRVKESPNVCRVSSPPLLLSPNHLASLWEEVEEAAENTQLIQEPENGNIENGMLAFNW